ncbi:MAG: DNA cytosine methyltransferase [Alphaproteobacteria bacterium]
MSNKTYKFIDLFSGIGAFHQAFKMSKGDYQCVFASDIDTYCQKAYQANYGIMPVGNIKKIDAKDIPNHDILCAGFPCQPFSISGLQKGFNDNRGDLFFEILRIVKEKKPSLILLENVKNLSTHNQGETLKVILQSLEQHGYKTSYKILNAKNFGLAQNRERIFIIASKKNHLIFENKAYDTVILDDIIDKNIKGLPQSKLADLRFNKYKNSNHRIHKPLRIGAIKKAGQGDRIYSQYGISIALSASSGGTGAKTGLYYIDDEIRRLTLNECRKVHGFSDDFKIVASEAQAYKQFGNTIPVNILRYIIELVEKQQIL